MRGNRRTDTRPEVALRRELHARGLRFRKDFPVVTETARPHVDIAFTRSRVAVFVDGCFWHGCPDHGHIPGGKNATYWAAKLTRNAERDARDTEALADAGWTVVRIWEHEPVDTAVSTVLAALSSTSPPKATRR